MAGWIMSKIVFVIQFKHLSHDLIMSCLIMFCQCKLSIVYFIIINKTSIKFSNTWFQIYTNMLTLLHNTIVKILKRGAHKIHLPIITKAQQLNVCAKPPNPR